MFVYLCFLALSSVAAAAAALSMTDVTLFPSFPWPPLHVASCWSCDCLVSNWNLSPCTDSIIHIISTGGKPIDFCVDVSWAIHRPVCSVVLLTENSPSWKWCFGDSHSAAAHFDVNCHRNTENRSRPSSSVLNTSRGSGWDRPMCR